VELSLATRGGFSRPARSGRVQKGGSIPANDFEEDRAFDDEVILDGGAVQEACAREKLEGVGAGQYRRPRPMMP